MTFLDILKEYDPEVEIIYPSNYYNDMRKKLAVAFECVGLRDLDVFKSANGKDYAFFGESKDYLFYLLRSETSPLFRNIKSGNMTLDNYAELAYEVDKLLVFIEPYIRDKDEYRDIISEIYSNVRYPIIKRYEKSQSTFYALEQFYEGIVRGDGEVTKIGNWVYLTEDDKAKLFDELISVTKRWVTLVEKMGDYRSDELQEVIDNATIDDVLTYCLVDEAIADEYIKAIDKPEPPTAKSRSVKSKIAKIKASDDKNSKIKLELAKRYCESHGIDFDKYLAEKELMDKKLSGNDEYTHLSTDKVFEEILKEI